MLNTVFADAQVQLYRQRVLLLCKDQHLSLKKKHNQTKQHFSIYICGIKLSGRSCSESGKHGEMCPNFRIFFYLHTNSQFLCSFSDTSHQSPKSTSLQSILFPPSSSVTSFLYSLKGHKGVCTSFQHLDSELGLAK